ncbi:MAG: 50S ribosomal protein L10 [Eubacteriaceae bacterium]|nr:50S ribosomal protein L10 [Eubacteriaceae bacterium]
MSANIESKKQTVAEISQKFKNAKSIVLVDYKGISVEKATILRNKARDANIDYKVYKNTLARIAAKESGCEGLSDYLVGSIAIAVSDADQIAPAKLLADFIKENKILEIKGGFVDGRVLSPKEVESLATLPSKEELVAKMLGSLKSPLYGLANVLNGNIRGLVVALNAIKEQKQSA